MEVEKNSSYVKWRCRIIDKLISIKVLWELFYSNTPIKVNSRLYLFIIYHLFSSSFLVILLCRPSLPSPLCSIYGWGSFSPNSYLKAWIVFCQASTIKPVLWLILMVCFCYLVNTLTNTNDILKSRSSVTPLLSSHCWLTWWHTKDGYLSDLCHRASFLEYSMAY